MADVEWVDDPGPDLDTGPGRRESVLRYVLALAGAALAAGVLIGLGFAPTRVVQHTEFIDHPSVAVSGTIILTSGFDSLGGIDQDGCLTNSGPFSDIQVGTPVLVFDTRPAVVGATTLGHPVFDGRTCRFSFAVSVPDSGQWYELQVGNRELPAVPRSQVGDVQVTLD